VSIVSVSNFYYAWLFLKVNVYYDQDYLCSIDTDCCFVQDGLEMHYEILEIY